jgi:hypothetical protein
MDLPSRLPRGRAVLLVDLLVVAWVVVWVAIAINVAHQVRDIGRITRSVERIGSAVSDTGAQLEKLGNLPLLGDRIADTGKPIRDAGRQAQATARMSRASAHDLSKLLGITISLVPSLPLLLLYVPQRVAMERDRRVVAKALRSGREDELQETLAYRAVMHLPLSRLRAVTRTPRADLAARRFDRLAEAELERLGIRVPASWR